MHRAHYDSDGNIILDQDVREAAADTQELDEPAVILTEIRRATWTVIPDTSMPQVCIQTETTVRKERVVQPGLISASMTESGRQLHATAHQMRQDMQSVSKDLRKLPRRLKGTLRTFWTVATTPVLLPRSAKPKTKLGLFVTDTIRFGGTFGLIFGVLFVGINYQSFFQIARAQLALGTDIQTEQALEDLSRGTSERPLLSGTIASFRTVNILHYLPNVGPYENRIVIPKLGKNVPIVKPSMDALMNEDWKQFETDIQTALRDGVVHYPGSAKPGQAGNFFLTGHSSYYPWDDGQYKDVFARLPELEVGDTYFVYYGGDKHTYRIVKKYEVKPSDVTVLDQPSDKRLATLMTCTPIGTTLRRLIIQAEEIDPISGMALKVGEKTEEHNKEAFSRLEALPI